MRAKSVLLTIPFALFLVSCGSKTKVSKNDNNSNSQQGKKSDDFKTVYGSNDSLIPSSDETLVVKDKSGKDVTTAKTAKDRVFFAFDTYNLTQEAQNILKGQVAIILSSVGTADYNIMIEGYADERGTREYNLALSEKRANAVKVELVKNGLKSKNITVVGYGKENAPVKCYKDICTGEEVWSRNRVAITKVATK